MIRHTISLFEVEPCNMYLNIRGRWRLHSNTNDSAYTKKQLNNYTSFWLAVLSSFNSSKHSFHQNWNAAKNRSATSRLNAHYARCKNVQFYTAALCTSNISNELTQPRTEINVFENSKAKDNARSTFFLPARHQHNRHAHSPKVKSQRCRSSYRRHGSSDRNWSISLSTHNGVEMGKTFWNASWICEQLL